MLYFFQAMQPEIWIQAKTHRHTALFLDPDQASRTNGMSGLTDMRIMKGDLFLCRNAKN